MNNEYIEALEKCLEQINHSIKCSEEARDKIFAVIENIKREEIGLESKRLVMQDKENN